MIEDLDRVTVRRGPGVPAPPRVSVVIPAHGMAWLEEALHSVRMQTCRDLEIIVVDDGTPEPLAPACTDDLVLVRQANAGPGVARNRGVAIARGELVAFLDSDDLWYPAKVQHQVAFHERHPDMVLSCTDACSFGAGEHEPGLVRRRYRVRPGLVPFAQLFLENFVVCSSAMVRREAYLRTAGMAGGLETGEDYAEWLRLARLGPIGYVDEVLVARRLRETSLMGTSRQDVSWLQVERRLYEDFLAEHPEVRHEPFVRQALARLEAQGGYHQLARAQWSAARRSFMRSLRHEPARPRSWRMLVQAVLHVGPR